MSKQAKHVAKMARKRAIKATRRAKYLALAGTSKKKKHQHQATHTKFNHATQNCGNIGCKKCYPILNKVVCI